MGMFRIRCAVSRVPLNAGDAVVAIPVETWLVENTEHRQAMISGLPVEGHMDEYGQVIAEGFLSTDYKKSMIVNAAVSHALSMDPELSTTAILADLNADLADLVVRAAQEENAAMISLLVMTAQAKLSEVPILLPHDQEDKNKQAMMENLFFLQEVADKVGWLQYSQDVLGLRLESSADDATNIIKEEGLRVARVITEAAHAESPAPGIRGVSL